MPPCFSDRPVWVIPTDKSLKLDQKTLVIVSGKSRTPARIRMTKGGKGSEHTGKCYFDVLGTGFDSKEPEMEPGWGSRPAPVATLDPYQRYLTEEALGLIVPNPNPQERIYGELRLMAPDAGEL